MNEEVNSLAKSIEDGLSFSIPIDVDAKSCVDLFLQKKRDQISKYFGYQNYSKKIDYLLMRRFIFTAYNNLVEMDHNISISRVAKPKEILLETQQAYRDLESHIKKPPLIIFENLFLSKQKSYNDVKKHFHKVLGKIEFLNTKIAIAYSSKKSLQEKLSGLIPKSEEFQRIDFLLKKANKEYVDKLHELSELKTKSVRLHDVLKNFEKENSMSFGEYFHKKANELLDKILNILCAVSYEFDTILWEEARESQIIKKFFIEAKIDGSFSSKTYLKYFLKTLEVEILRDEYKKLFELLEYLERMSAKHIFLLCNDSDEANKEKHLLEGIDKDIHVFPAISPDKIFTEHKKRPFDLIILDYELKQIDGISLILKFWNDFSGTKSTVPVFMRFKNPNYKIIDDAGRAGIRYMARKNIQPKDFMKKIVEIFGYIEKE